jgi:hypothetical protein
VGFYLVSKETMKSEDGVLIAQFIGSDYNYATERPFRDEFRGHTPPPHAELLDIGLREGGGAGAGENAAAGPPLYDESGRNCLIPI